MKKYILAIDQGTTSTRAVLVNHDGDIIYKAQRQIDSLYPNPGWVEQDPNMIWVSVNDVVNELLIVSGVRFDEIAAIGLTTQRESTIVWNKNTGKAIYNSIVWQSKQTNYLCEERNDKMEFIQKRTGLRMNSYFSASKIRYILDHVDGAQELAEEGLLAFGTVDSWLIYKLTNGKVHATDTSNASRTMLFNIHELSWDEKLFELWNIPIQMAPSVQDSASDFGVASFFSEDIHIHGVAGDQQAALFGQCCFEAGESKNTYGTGCFMLMNIGNKVVHSKKGLLTTIAWSINGQPTYALEGSVFIGGSVVQWVRDQTKWIDDYGESESYAKEVPDTAGVYFVPAFVGLGTPYWDEDARGAIFGLTRGAERHHITRAALNAIAYQSKDVIDAMVQEANIDLTLLKVDGGASNNNLLMQFQSDILRCEIRQPKYIETTALGGAYLAGISCGFWNGLDELRRCDKSTKVFNPTMPIEEADELYKGWLIAVKACQMFKIK